MSSVAQIEANRSNASNSTGPRTPEGKAVASRNAVRHGLLSSQVLIPGESAQEFAEHGRQMREDLAPLGPVEELLADRVITQSWRLRRVLLLEGRMLEVALAETNVLAEGPPSSERGERRLDHFQRMDLRDGLLSGGRGLEVLRRYERAIEQGMYQALRELKQRQTARREGERRPRQDSAREADRGLDRASITSRKMLEGMLREEQEYMREIEQRRQERQGPQAPAEAPPQTDPIPQTTSRDAGDAGDHTEEQRERAEQNEKEGTEQKEGRSQEGPGEGSPPACGEPDPAAARNEANPPEDQPG